MKKIIVLTIMLAGWMGLFAQQNGRGPQKVPAVPYPVEYVQPDGDTLTIRVFGDEHGSWRTTIDYYVLAENSKQTLCYAKVGRDGIYKPTHIKAHNPEDRSRRELRYIKKMDKNEKLRRGNGQ